MKILIAVHNFDEIRGQQTFIGALINRWVSDEITIFSPIKGKIADIYDIEVVNYLNDEYDFILMFHYFPELERAKAYKVYYCNDTNARFFEFNLYKVDKFICISEEIQKKMAEFNISSEIIRNGINVNKFLDIVPVNEKIKSIMLFNYIPDKELITLKKVCEKNKINLDWRFLLYDNKKFWLERQMNNHDLIISVGRGCYEAMSCGREVLVWGNYGLDGLASSDFDNFLTCNCSGRYNSFKITDNDRLQFYIDSYSADKARANRQLIINKMNIQNVAKAIRDLYPNDK